MSKALTEELITGILQKIPGQTFSIKRIRKMWTPEEEARFERELEYLTEKYSLDKIVEGYIFMTTSNMEESRYFQEHGEYRYHSFAEVDRNIYANEEQMTLYMLGLSLTEYLWETVLRIHRFYEDTIKSIRGNSYLEIGPGHGKYFLEAYNLGNFKEYVAVDVSQTAIDMTKEYMRRYGKQEGVKYELLCQDATLLDGESKYDFIVAQEVLEHVEKPLELLKSMGKLLSPEGRAYVLMPITAPSPAHIYLFESIEHVKSIVNKAGFEIVTEEYITVSNTTIEAAEKKKLPIDACLILKKRG